MARKGGNTLGTTILSYEVIKAFGHQKTLWPQEKLAIMLADKVHLILGCSMGNAWAPCSQYGISFLNDWFGVLAVGVLDDVCTICSPFRDLTLWHVFENISCHYRVERGKWKLELDPGKIHLRRPGDFDYLRCAPWAKSDFI